MRTSSWRTAAGAAAIAGAGMVGWLGGGTASAQTCGYDAANCPPATVPATSPPPAPTPIPAPAQASSTATVPSQGLAFTGFDTTLTVLVGLGAVGAGSVLVRRSRQRA
jgi:hypothetical protein